MSPVLTRISSTYPDKSKHNKKGECNVGYCQYWGYEHKHKPRVQSHKTICEARLKKKSEKEEDQVMKNEQSLEFVQQNQIYEVINKPYTEKELQLIEENRILRQKLAQLEGKKFEET